MRIIKPMAGSDPIPDELLAEIAQLLAGSDGAATKTPEGWTYDKPKAPPIDGGTVRRLLKTFDGEENLQE